MVSPFLILPISYRPIQAVAPGTGEAGSQHARPRRGRTGRLTAARADHRRPRDAVGLLDDLGELHVEASLGEDGVLAEGEEALEDGALGEVGVVRPLDDADAQSVDDLAERERLVITALARRPHAPFEIRIPRQSLTLKDDAALEVDGSEVELLLDALEVLAGDRCTVRHLAEDDGGVGDHDECRGKGRRAGARRVGDEGRTRRRAEQAPGSGVSTFRCRGRSSSVRAEEQASESIRK